MEHAGCRPRKREKERWSQAETPIPLSSSRWAVQPCSTTTARWAANKRESQVGDQMETLGLERIVEEEPGSISVGRLASADVPVQAW